MPVMVLDVPLKAWNQVVIQSVLHGVEMCPDIHKKQGNTVVEVTGSWEKLNQVLTKVKRRGPEIPELLGVMASKPIDYCD